jgi:hypothetical protein
MADRLGEKVDRSRKQTDRSKEKVDRSGKQAGRLGKMEFFQSDLGRVANREWRSRLNLWWNATSGRVGVSSPAEPDACAGNGRTIARNEYENAPGGRVPPC